MWIALIVIALLAVWAIALYNSLVRAKKQVENAWSQIDVQLKRRYDLIPNLIECVKGYAAHEKSVLEGVTQARANAIAAGNNGSAERIAAEAKLGGALKGLMVQMEAYPQLRANENFLQLQDFETPHNRPRPQYLKRLADSSFSLLTDMDDVTQVYKKALEICSKLN